VPFLELGAKLGKEIGGTAADDTRPVIFNFFTNLNPLALAGPTPPGWPVQDLPRISAFLGRAGMSARPRHRSVLHGHASTRAHRSVPT